MSLTRENLHPRWCYLDERTSDARREFREGGDEGHFRKRLAALGFHRTDINIEVEQNRPPAISPAEGK